MHFAWKRTLFDAFSPIVHTQRIENDLKGLTFKNAAFWKRTVSKVDGL